MMDYGGMVSCAVEWIIVSNNHDYEPYNLDIPNEMVFDQLLPLMICPLFVNLSEHGLYRLTDCSVTLVNIGKHIRITSDT